MYNSIFVSVPSDFGGLSVDAYISGIVCGILQGSGFPARVTAHSVALEESEVVPPNLVLAAVAQGSSSAGSAIAQYNPTTGMMMSSSSSSANNNSSTHGGMAALPPRREKTVFLVKFAQSVLTRDAAMA